MKRNVSLEEISDGRLYELNDMVRADCNGCAGCSACCRGVGNSIVLDPRDVFRLLSKLGGTFEDLMKDKIELHVEEGVILPNLKMVGASESCSFLNEEGRCAIHAIRPDICRLFPLGRYYVNQDYKYILQIHECAKANKSKVKVKKWIDTPELDKHRQFVLDWHFHVKAVQNYLNENQNDAKARAINMFLLQNFYTKPYDKQADFYLQFKERLAASDVFLTENGIN